VQPTARGRIKRAYTTRTQLAVLLAQERSLWRAHSTPPPPPLLPLPPGVCWMACQVLLPLGSMTKAQVRAIAREAGLANASRKDSVGICFIGKRKLGGGWPIMPSPAPPPPPPTLHLAAPLRIVTAAVPDIPPPPHRHRLLGGCTLCAMVVLPPADFLSNYMSLTPGEFRDIDTGATVGTAGPRRRAPLVRTHTLSLTSIFVQILPSCRTLFCRHGCVLARFATPPLPAPPKHPSPPLPYLLAPLPAPLHPAWLRPAQGL
jgi:hypothetical protein